MYRKRAASESPSSLRAHPPAVRYTLLAALCFMRLREVTDGLVEVLLRIVHTIGARRSPKFAILGAMPSGCRFYP